MQTHVQVQSCRRALAAALALLALTLLTACRGDDLQLDVFVDPNHCVREPDAAPLGMCDVPAVDAVDATATQ